MASCPVCETTVHDGSCYECGIDVAQTCFRSDGLLGAAPKFEAELIRLRAARSGPFRKSRSKKKR